MTKFQKRGLPHVHMLLIMHSDDKPRSPEDYDGVVSADLPDNDTSPELYATVVKSLIHGPCGHLNQKANCMVVGKCSKSYPRDFSEQTRL